MDFSMALGGRCFEHVTRESECVELHRGPLGSGVRGIIDVNDPHNPYGIDGWNKKMQKTPYVSGVTTSTKADSLNNSLVLDVVPDTNPWYDDRPTTFMSSVEIESNYHE